MKVDFSNAEVTLDLVDHQARHGEMFGVYNHDTDVDIAVPKLWRLTTPANTKAVLRFEVRGTGSFTLEVLENPTVSAAGTGLTAINRNRQSDALPTVTAFADTTISADGTVAMTLRSGSVFFGKPLVLKADEDYVFRATVDADNTELVFAAEWSEE